MAHGPRCIGPAVILQVKNQPAFIKSVPDAGDGRIEAGRAAQAAAFGFQVYADISPCYVPDTMIAYTVASCTVYRLSAAKAIC